MSLDGAFLRIVKNELLDMGLVGSRVDKIHQPSKEEIILTMRHKGGNKRLLFSANPAAARVSATEKNPENPQSPPMFCMLMRKYLGNGKLADIKQDGLERILHFDFIGTNEIGDMVKIRLSAEIMGRSSNIILTTEKDGEIRVIDSIKRVTDDISSVRRVLPNIIYEPPPREKRLIITDCSYDEVNFSLSLYRSQRLSKALIKMFEGISPIFARECAFYSARDVDVTVDEILDNSGQRERFLFFIKRSGEALKGKTTPVIVKDKNGKPKDFSFVNILQYGSEMIVEPFDSANALLDRFYSGRAESDRIRQRSGELLKHLLNIYERISRRIESQKLDLLECEKRDALRIKGDLINGNIYRLKKGDKELITEDFYTGESVTVSLSERLSPAENAQKYYIEYRKLDTAEKMLKKLIKSGAEELSYIDSVFDAASRAVSNSELDEIRIELSAQGYLKQGKDTKGKKSNKQLKPLPPMKFKSSDNVEILVGRNNAGNDKLTLKTAKPTDIWFHTQNIAGSHVIVSKGREPLSEKTLTEAAMLAAYCSKGRNSSRVPVDYTEVRYVKKPTGAKPGMVIFTNNKTLFVTPSAEIYNKLKYQEGQQL